MKTKFLIQPFLRPFRSAARRGLAVAFTCLLPALAGAQPIFVSFQEDDVRTNSDQTTVNISGTVVTNAYDTGATYLRDYQPDTAQNEAGPSDRLLIGHTYTINFPAGATFHALVSFDVSYLTNIIGTATNRLDTAAFILTHSSAQAGVSVADYSVYLTKPFNETNATWNNPHGTAGVDQGGFVGEELRRLLCDPNLGDPAKKIWGSPAPFWPSTTNAPDKLVSALRTAIATGSNTLYFLVKQSVETTNVSTYMRMQADRYGFASTANGRPELIVGIDSLSALVTNTLSVVASVPQVQRSDVANPAKFNIIRSSGATNLALTVDYFYGQVWQGSTAIPDIDFTPTPSTAVNQVTIPAGQTNAEVLITPIPPGPEDSTNRYVVLFLGTPAGPNFPGYNVTSGQATVAIIPDSVAVTQPVITSISAPASTVTINFTGGATDTPSQFALQSSATVNGTYVDDNTAVITGSSGSYQATTAKSGATRFYRIRR
jgi:hypothetical protein